MADTATVVGFVQAVGGESLGGWVALGKWDVRVALTLSVPQLLSGGSLNEVLFGGPVSTCALVLVPFVWSAAACIGGSVQVATGYDWRSVFEHPSLLDARRAGGFLWGIESGLTALALALVSAAVAGLSISEWVTDKWLVAYPAGAGGRDALCGRGLGGRHRESRLSPPEDSTGTARLVPPRADAGAADRA